MLLARAVRCSVRWKMLQQNGLAVRAEWRATQMLAFDIVGILIARAAQKFTDGFDVILGLPTEATTITFHRHRVDHDKVNVSKRDNCVAGTIE